MEKAGRKVLLGTIMNLADATRVIDSVLASKNRFSKNKAYGGRANRLF